MKRTASSLLLAVLVSLAMTAAASAEFSLPKFDVTFTGPDGSTQTQAGSHPYAFTTSLEVGLEETPEGVSPEEMVKDLEITQVPGFVGDQTYPRCNAEDFINRVFAQPQCPESTVVGFARI